jgi:hypothetical protein
MLHLIKIDFSLIQNTLKQNSDYCLSFIKLIKEYKLPILGSFYGILRRIHEGINPENELIEIITPSSDFNRYLKDLLINNFSYSYKLDDIKESNLEHNFKIYLREIQSKISIIFFIGIFFPLGLCFLILFQVINIFFLIFLIPFFLYLLNFLSHKFLRRNTYMMGFLNEYSRLEKKKFNEFLLFLKSFAANLKYDISPEKAFLKSYIQNKDLFEVLELPIKTQLSRLLNFNCSFREMIQFFKIELKSIRYNIILDAIEKFVSENASFSSEKILDLLEVVHKHQKLEKKLEIIIKGEKFKIFLFIFLLPILIGVVSGMFPFFISITRNINLIIVLSFDFKNIVNIYFIIIILAVFVSSITITSNNFLNIINYQKKFIVIFMSNLIFILTFLSSFINTIGFI